jgi:hypothetical protein
VPGEAITLSILEIYQTLEIYFPDSDLSGEFHKTRKLGNIILGSQKPQGQLWVSHPLPFLKPYEGSKIFNNLLKFIAVADFPISMRRGGIQRDAQFVQPGLDEITLQLAPEKYTIGIKQRIHITPFEVSDDFRDFVI